MDCPLFVDIYFACPLSVPFSFYYAVSSSLFLVILPQQKVRKIKPEDDLDYQTETLMQILSAAENISVPRKLLRMKGPKWKASPEVLVLLNL
jgi:hypothetical protein